MSPSTTKVEFGRLTFCNMTGARSLSQLHTLQYPGKGGVGAAVHGGGGDQVDDGCMKQIESASTHSKQTPQGSIQEKEPHSSGVCRCTDDTNSLCVCMLQLLGSHSSSHPLAGVLLLPPCVAVVAASSLPATL